MIGPDGTHLGDGVYATYDGLTICLTAQRGDRTERVYLEPAVYAALQRYATEAWGTDT